MALREFVPAATAPLPLSAGRADRPVRLSTVLPQGWPGMVRLDGGAFVGLQVASRSGDASRDLAAVLEQVLTAEVGTPVAPAGLPGPGPRLQDLLERAPLQVTVQPDFDYWLEGSEDPSGEVLAAIERGNASVVPTARLSSVTSAYWCRLRTRAHLRWVLPEDEEPVLDALARLGTDGLSLGTGSRFVGSFRAHGLLVPVWDLPVDTVAPQLEEPARRVRERLAEALAEPRPLDAEQRRVRAGLLSRQLTLR